MKKESQAERQAKLEAAAAMWAKEGFPESLDENAVAESLIAGIRDGLINPASLTAEEIQQIQKAFSPEECVQILFELDSPTAEAITTHENEARHTVSESLPFTPQTSLSPRVVEGPRQILTNWISHNRKYLMTAAAFIVVASTALLVLLPKPPDPISDILANAWNPLSANQMASLTIDETIRFPLDQAPDYNLRDLATLGSGGTDPYFDWRLKTVIVRVKKGHGSGALVGPRHVLTNYHVVAGPVQQAALTGATPHVSIILPHVEGEGTRRRVTRQQGEFRATVIRTSPGRDLALLRLDELPAGVTALPYFELADSISTGTEVMAIGSAGQGLGWGIKTGTAVRFRVPDDYMAMQIRSEGSTGGFSRFEGDILSTECEIAPGYSGGPLCDAESGKLVGITFAAPAGDAAEQAALHIALEHIREFLGNDLDEITRSPLDVWTGGLPGALRTNPDPVDVDGNGKTDRVRIVFVERSDSGMERVANVDFIDLQERTTIASLTTRDALTAQKRTMPAGLWGFVTPGQFRFDVFILSHAGGVVAFGYTNDAGIVDEIRIGSREKRDVAHTIWRRSNDGDWSVSHPTAGAHLLNVDRLGCEGIARLTEVLKNYESS